MADKKITELQLRDNVTADVNFPTDDGIQSYRVTAQQVKDYILSALSISTAMLQNLSVTSGKIAAGAVSDDKTNFTPPTVQRLTASSGTYTTPTGAKYIRIKMVGGGGGGGGSGSGSGGAGSSGSATTFGTSLLSAGGGGGGAWGGTGTAGGAGGTASTINSPAIEVFKANGGGGSHIGGAYNASSTFTSGGPGGSNHLFQNLGTSGTSIPANTGLGGIGGNSGGSSVVNGTGGGAGMYVEAIIYNPSASYSFACGAGGGGGTAGTNGNAGTAGTAGLIIVEEFYQ